MRESARGQSSYSSGQAERARMAGTLEHAATGGNTANCRIACDPRPIRHPRVPRTDRCSGPAFGDLCAKRKIAPHPRLIEPIMRTEQPVPIRLQDYRPPDWLVETVDLDVSLDPTATRVRATLRLKPNPKAAAPAPLVLDGDGLKLVSLDARRRSARPRPLCRRRPTASPSRSRRSGRSRSRSRPSSIRPPTPSSWASTVPAPPTARSARPKAFAASPITPTARRDGGVHHPHRGRQGRVPGAARQRQSRWRPATCPAPSGISRSGTIRSRSRPICSRWWAAISPASRTASAPCRDAT